MKSKVSMREAMTDLALCLRGGSECGGSNEPCKVAT